MNIHTIGIDFGTTKTLVSHINPQTLTPEVIKLGRDAAYLPTTAYIDSAGQLFFGDEADDMLEDVSGCYLRGFKMHLGSDTPLHMYLKEGRPYMLTARELVKEYLSYIRSQVEALVFHGEPVERVTITRPVKFSPTQCDELKQAALEAGFVHVEFTTEPESAGLAFCRLNAAQAFQRSALIVDWGGGTLDIALVTRQGNHISTHRQFTDGDNTMGGEKFDEKLWNDSLIKLNNLGVEKLNHTSQLPKLRRAKEQLSAKDQTTLRLSYEGGVCPPIHLSRADFHALIENDLDQAAQKVQALLARIPAELKPEMLLLVGGSSRIPSIKEKLEGACLLPAHNWHYSREAVAMGAALWCADASIGTSPLQPQQVYEEKPTLDTVFPTPQPQVESPQEPTVTPSAAVYAEPAPSADTEPVQRTVPPSETEGEMNAPTPTKKKSKYIAALLALTLGCLGAHKFYHGKILWGIIYCAVTIFAFPITLFISLIVAFPSRSSYTITTWMLSTGSAVTSLLRQRKA